MDFPWHSFTMPEPDAELVGVVGELRPHRHRTVPRVVRSTRRIETQLADSDGLVGYVLRAELLRRRFWAISVWEDNESLRTFVREQPHVETMAVFREKTETSRFERFDVTGSEVPLEVDEAIARVR